MPYDQNNKFDRKVHYALIFLVSVCVALSILGLFGVYEAHASTLEINNSNQTTAYNTTYITNSAGFTRTCQTFIPASTFEASKIAIYGGYLNGTAHNRRLLLVETTGTEATMCNGAVLWTSDFQSMPAANTPNPEVEFVIDPFVALSSGTTYGFVLESDLSANDTFNYSANTGEYANGQSYLTSGAATSTWAIVVSTRDIAFKLYSDISTPSLDFVFPTEATSTDDFYNWEVDVSNFVNASEDAYNFVRLQYSNDSFESTFTDYTPTFATSSDVIHSTAQKSHLLSFGEWQVNADLITQECAFNDLYVRECTDTILASSYIYFYVSGTLPIGGYYETPTSTATSSQWTLDCSGNGIIGDSLCSVFKYLFMPDSSVLDKYSSLSDGLKDKPPFGYFGAVVSALQGIDDTATSTLEMPDTTELEENFFNPIDDVLELLLWIVFCFWIFHRIKDFTF